MDMTIHFQIRLDRHKQIWEVTFDQPLTEDQMDAFIQDYKLNTDNADWRDDTTLWYHY